MTMTSQSFNDFQLPLGMGFHRSDPLFSLRRGLLGRARSRHTHACTHIHPRMHSYVYSFPARLFPRKTAGPIRNPEISTLFFLSGSLNQLGKLSYPTDFTCLRRTARRGAFECFPVGTEDIPTKYFQPIRRHSRTKNRELINRYPIPKIAVTRAPINKLHEQ